MFLHTWIFWIVGAFECKNTGGTKENSSGRVETFRVMTFSGDCVISRSLCSNPWVSKTTECYVLKTYTYFPLKKFSEELLGNGLC